MVSAVQGANSGHVAALRATVEAMLRFVVLVVRHRMAIAILLLPTENVPVLHMRCAETRQLLAVASTAIVDPGLRGVLLQLARRTMGSVLPRQCGGAGGSTCLSSVFGSCCSADGQCGNSLSACGPTCQPGFGDCWLFLL